MTDTILAARQRLKDEAYKLVLKSMISKEQLDSALLSKMRMELSIGSDSHRKWLSELMQSKKNNTLFSNVGPSTAYQAPAAAMPATSAAQNNRLPAMQSLASSSAAAAPAAAMRSGAAAGSRQPPPDPKADKGGGGGGSKSKKMKSLAPAGPAGTLMPDYIGRKVRRWWLKDNAWYDGVITDFQQHNGQYCVTYDLGTKTESFEWLDCAAHIAEGHLKITNDRVDLRNYPKSRAVRVSSVLNPKGKGVDDDSDSGGGGSVSKASKASKKKATKAAAAPTGRKRTISALNDDSDFDDLAD